MAFRSLFASLSAALALCTLCPAAAVADQNGSSARPRDPAFTAVERMGGGVNILGYDGIWEGGKNAPFREEDFALIRAAGFAHVRINFFGFKYMDAAGRLDPAVLERLDAVLDETTRNGLTPVLDQHSNKLCQTAPSECKAKLVAFWRQIASRYAGRRSELIYEVLNEPGGEMKAAEWNETLAAALTTIRQRDPERIVIVAALNAGDPHDIEKLALPTDDRRLILTVHYYEPMSFTHQGAPWSPTFAAERNVDWGSAKERARMIEDLVVARDWAVSQNRPIYLGEFGVYDRAPSAARATWIGAVAKTAERFGWAWAYWQFDHDFALFDSATHRWNRRLVDALVR